MHAIQEKLLRIVSEKNIGSLTLRKIGSLVGEKYPQKIKHHLGQLERRGFITINKATNRIERVAHGQSKDSLFISIPIVGTANCGPATLFADENVEGYLKVSSALLGKKKNVFAIRASGLSMNKAVVGGKTIEDGDYLIIDPLNRVPEHKDVVLCIIDDAATVKRYVWDDENKNIVLVSDSTKNFPPIYIHPEDAFSINGKVVQIIKKPRL